MANPIICIVGLGYVGLPLACAFSRKGFTVYGYDVNAERVAALKNNEDSTGELTSEELQQASITYSADPEAIGNADVVIVAVPTPINNENKPDLSILKSATQTVGAHMKKGAIVVFESTVYPGTTEEICAPILAEASGFVHGQDFAVGYSPERINPGDKEHTVAKIVKVVAGEDAKTTEALLELYGAVVEAGVHEAQSIKVAEMAKAIENAQRDLNIAFVNEIAMLCNKMSIPSKDVFKAAGTKWNFLRFQPGLVGGHCIGVDPYYLVETAEMLGMQTKVITAGRSVNDGMGAHVAQEIVDALGNEVAGAKVLLLGVTFKENVPDMRNSKVKDVAIALEKHGCIVVADDAMLTQEELKEYGYTPGSLTSNIYNAIVYLVPHKEYTEMPLSRFIDATKEDGVIFDLKSLLEEEAVVQAGRVYRAL